MARSMLTVNGELENKGENFENLKKGERT